MRNLTCVAKPGLSDDDVSKLFGTVCGLDKSACAGIARDGSTGEYGSLSMCNSTEKLSWVFNAYYMNQSPANKASACNFDGNAQTRQPASPSGTCQNLLMQLGPAATGSVTATPTANNGGSGGGSGSSGSSATDSGSGSSSTATKKGSAGAVTVPAFDFGMLRLGAYVASAILAGAGMIIL